MLATLGLEDFDSMPTFQARPASEVNDQMRALLVGEVLGDQLHWAILEQRSRCCLGGVQVMRKEQRLFVGYRVAGAFQGAGIATGALRVLQRISKARWPEQTLFASIAPDNAASLRVVAKTGFVEVAPTDASFPISAATDRVFCWSPPERAA